MREELIEAIVGMKETEALAMADGWLGRGVDPLVVLDACSRAMEVVGERFEAGEYFLPELMMAGEILRQISERVKPGLGKEIETARRGRVVIGTVKGDIHDIGKDLVVFMLQINGFEVIDLGIDVAPERFVEAVRQRQPHVVGLSGFLTLAFASMKETVHAIAMADLRDRVKIMIGGGQVDEEVRRYTGADAYGLHAMDAVNLSKGWTGGH